MIRLPALPPVFGVAAVLGGLISTLLYIRHARRIPAPLLDLSLFSIRSYRAAVLGMSLFRMGSGAVPFLMPLLLQLGFGMTPFQSGLITFIGAVGAIMVKFVAPSRSCASPASAPCCRSPRASAALLIAVAGFFTPKTRRWRVIILTLLIGGLFRSLFFTAVNALTFADIERPARRRRPPSTSVLQQISIALGVALGGAILELSSTAGGNVTQTSFLIAFLAIGSFTVVAAIPFVLLPRSTGADVSGHRKYLHVGRDDGKTRPGPTAATSGRDVAE